MWEISWLILKFYANKYQFSVYIFSYSQQKMEAEIENIRNSRLDIRQMISTFHVMDGIFTWSSKK